ncbi:MAG TPA: outer membrane beta-barrel protein [Terriglobales bacterium]|nr:outer membrane beta-barrel protein [Terriglobales bacterium]
MRNLIALAFAAFLFSTSAAAQIPTKGNVYFGYSYYNTNLSSIDRGNLNGWNGSLEGKFLPWVGLVADFSGNYGSQNFPAVCITGPCPSINSNVSVHNFLFGPRLSVSVSKFTPFVHVLIGASHVKTNGFGSDTSFGDAVGGGLDYRLFHIIAWRFQGDYVNTRFFSSTQNNLRLSTGLVLRF